VQEALVKGEQTLADTIGDVIQVAGAQLVEDQAGRSALCDGCRCERLTPLIASPTCCWNCLGLKRLE